MIYTITLNPALDYVMSVDKLTMGSINRSSCEAVYYGGKGINVSAVLSRLEVDNKALGFVAGFTGTELEKMLSGDNIKSDFVRLAKGSTRINVKLRSDVETDINAAGPDINEDDIKSLISKLDCVGTGDYVVLAGSVPDNLPSDIYERILSSFADRDVNFVVDAAGGLLINSLSFKPFLIKPNHIELGELFGVKLEKDEDIILYAKRLQALGARNVLVSMAERGAILVDENSNIHKAGVAEGKLINSVGCGDSMLAGFIAGYIKENNYDYALKLGTACGCATAFSPQLATKEEIENVLMSKFGIV